MKILLVEDHPSLAEISCRLLREIHGHEVTHAPTVEDALQVTKHFVPDLALIDLNLPGKDGYELAGELRGDPRFDRTVLVALTGFGGVVDEGKAKASGFDARFRKPMDFDLLEQLKRQNTRE